MAKLFSKPKWLRPEINEPKYYFHILILAVVVTQIMSWFGYFNGLQISLIIKLGLAIILGDILAHSLLGLD